MRGNISVKTLVASGKRFGITLPAGSLPAAVEALRAYFLREFGEEALATCEACGNESPEYDLDGAEVKECPYCGTAFEGEPSEKDALEDLPEEESEEEVEEEEENGDIEGTELDEEEEDDVEGDLEDEEQETDEADADEEEEDAEDEANEEAAPEAPRKRGRPRLSEAEKAARAQEKAERLKERKKSAVKIPKVKAPKEDVGAFEYKGALANTSEELEKSVGKILDLRNNIAINAYDIGIELNHINSHELWRNSQYKSFYDFCHGELDFSRASAYKYMLCAREFDRETFVSIGVKKGELIASVEPTLRGKLIKEAASGATHADLIDTIGKMKGKPRQRVEMPDKGEAKPRPAPKPEEPAFAGRIKLGEFPVPWYQQGTKSQIKTGNVRARYAVISILEDVELYLVPNESETGLVACFRKKS